MNTLSWHQQRAAGFHALPYDVVGYVWNASDATCEDCGTVLGGESA